MNKRKSSARRGAAMIISIWTIAILSLLVLSFALDAKLEGKIDMYVRNRRHVDHLTQSGIAIAEMILFDYKNASSSTENQGSGLSGNSKSGAGKSASGGSGGAKDSGVSKTAGNGEEDENEDPWLLQKLDLQHGKCQIVNYPVDADHPESGTVSVTIESADANKWPINRLEKNDTSDLIWEAILTLMGLPMEYHEEIIDSWYDWRDADNTVTGRNGAEDEFYSDLEMPYRPRNNEISSVEELTKIRGIRDHLAVFDPGSYDNGLYNPEERDKKKQIKLAYGLKDFFDIWGENVKINVNSAPKHILLSVPGMEGDEELVSAIIQERESGENRDDRYSNDDAVQSTYFSDWSDLNSRIPGIPTTCEGYLSYSPESYFRIRVTGNSAGVTHTIEAVAAVVDTEIRYLRWREDP